MAELKDVLSILSTLSDDEIIELIRSSPEWKDAIKSFDVSDLEYPADPADFARDVLGYNLWQKQIDVAESVKENPNTIVSSGHSTGKSHIASSIASWWLSTNKDEAVVLTLAPTFTQVNSVLWRYLRHMVRRNKLPGIIYDTPRWEISELRYGVGLSPKKATEVDIATLQGYHSPKLLVIMDEAAGMPRIMFDAIRNLATGENNRILAIGNPIARSGPFWEACNSTSWNYIHISCLDHPNVVENKEIIPGAVSRGWVQQMIDDHCIRVEESSPDTIVWNGITFKTDPVFQSRVLVVAPEEGDDQLIPSSWVLAAQMLELEGGGEKIIGLDPARSGGDYAAMVLRQGNRVLWVKRRRPKTQNASDEIASWLREEMFDNEVSMAYIDEIGIGAGVLDASRRLGLNVIGINSSRPSVKKRRFMNQRAEMYWKVREVLKREALELPDDDLLAADLIAPKYTWDYLGRIQIESKDEIRSRLGRSPDSGDALALTYMDANAPMDADGDDAVMPGISVDVQSSRWTTPRIEGAIMPSRWGIASSGKRRRRR